MSFCIYCGAPLNVDDRRCPQCGKELPGKTEENAQTYQGARPQQTYQAAQPQYQQPQYQQSQYQQPRYQQPYQAQPQYPAYQQPMYAPRVADPEKTIATTLNTLGFLHGIFAIMVMLFGYLSLAHMRIGTYRLRPDDDFAIPAFIFSLAMIAVSVAGLAVAASKRRGAEKILPWVLKLIGSAVFAILFLTVFA